MNLEFKVWKLKDDGNVGSKELSVDINDKEQLAKLKDMKKRTNYLVHGISKQARLELMRPISRQTNWTSEMVTNVHVWKLEGLSDRALWNKVFDVHKIEVALSSITRTLKQQANTDFAIDQELRDRVQALYKSSSKVKLTDDVIKEIVRLRVEENMAGTEISKRFGLGNSTANSVLREHLYEGMKRSEWERKQAGLNEETKLPYRDEQEDASPDELDLDFEEDSMDSSEDINNEVPNQEQEEVPNEEQDEVPNEDPEEVPNEEQAEVSNDEQIEVPEEDNNDSSEEDNEPVSNEEAVQVS